MKGLIHLYWGEGKGKTTAAMGLALRALGAGKTVTAVQFLKGRESGEIALLRALGAQVFRGKDGAPFTARMSDEERAGMYRLQTEHLRQAMETGADVLLLDEACAAVEKGCVDETLLRRAVLEKPPEQEVVLTGRRPADWMREAADYSTELRCCRHPYEKGIGARKGIEY